MILNILKIGKSKITCEYLIIIGTVYISVLISYRLKYDIEIFNVVNQFYTVAKGNRIFTLKMPLWHNDYFRVINFKKIEEKI